MSVKCFRELAAFLISSRSLHVFVQRPPAVHGDRIGVGGGFLSLRHLSYIHVVSGPEILCLLAQLYLIEIERLCFPRVQPGLIGEQGSGPVIGMRVNGPVCEDDVGLLIQQRVRDFFVSRRCHFYVPINIMQSDHLTMQQCTGPLGVGVPGGSQLLRRHMKVGGDAFGVSARQGQRHNIVPKIGIAGNGPAAAGLWVIHMGPYDDHLQFPLW